MARTALFLALALSPALSGAVVPGLPGDSDTPDYQCVGRIRGASGVLVGPNLVLTAKHVGVDNIYLPGYGYFAPTDAGIAHPDADILLYHIDPRGLSLPYTSVLADRVPAGGAITMVGYGVSGTLNQYGTGYDLNLPRGTRRKAPALVHRTEFMNFNGFQPGYSLISILRQNGQGALANGDSGGGIFESVRSTHCLVGINSFAAVWGNGVAYHFSSSDQHYFGSGAVSLSHYSGWLADNGANLVRRPQAKAQPPALVP